MVNSLTDDEAGKLFKHFLAYINDLNPEPPDRLTQITFEPIKQTLKRDLKKWEDKSKKNSESAKARWDMQNNANASERIKQDANHADSVSDIVSVSDSVNDKVKVSINNIEERKLKFATTLEPYLDKYGKDMLNNFFKYWTEPNKSNTKYRQELEKTWSLDRRLETWASKDFNITKKQTKNGNEPTIEAIHAATTAKY